MRCCFVLFCFGCLFVVCLLLFLQFFCKAGVVYWSRGDTQAFCLAAVRWLPDTHHFALVCPFSRSARSQLSVITHQAVIAWEHVFCLKRNYVLQFINRLLTLLFIYCLSSLFFIHLHNFQNATLIKQKIRVFVSSNKMTDGKGSLKSS